MANWMKVKEAAKYSGVTVRTFRRWLKDGLRHSRLKSGTILVNPALIDEYLFRYEVKESDSIDRVVNEVFTQIIR